MDLDRRAARAWAQKPPLCSFYRVCGDGGLDRSIENGGKELLLLGKEKWLVF
jgi:hypothetical protein